MEDVFDHRIVGHAMNDLMTAQLAVSALRGDRPPPTDRCRHGP